MAIRRITVRLLAMAGLVGVLVTGTVASDKPASAPVLKRVRVTPPELSGAVEVSVAINPTNPNHLIAASIARHKDHPLISDFAYVSTDAGASWKFVPRDNPNRVQQGDDVLTFTPNGTAIHTFISFTGIRQARPKRAHTGIVTSASKDGLTWNKQVPVIELFNSVEPFEDKPWMRADHAKDSKHRGNLYVAWTRFDQYGSAKPEHKTHVYASRSTDNGQSFAPPIRISEMPGDARDSSDTVMGACPAVGPNGEVSVVWAGPKHLFLAQSTDGGVTYGKNQALCDCAGWDFSIPGLGRVNGLPSIGADISSGPDRGSLYVVFADRRNGDPDVYLVVSRDGGKTWDKPQRVNAPGMGKDQFFPWLSVDPIDGSLNVVYYDRGTRDGTLTEVTLSRSVDGGRTFVHTTLTKEPFDLNRVGFFGDYLGLDSYGGRVAVLWMQPLDNTKRLGIDAAILDFAPGKQTGK